MVLVTCRRCPAALVHQVLAHQVHTSVSMDLRLEDRRCHRCRLQLGQHSSTIVTVCEHPAVLIIITAIFMVLSS